MAACCYTYVVLPLLLPMRWAAGLPAGKLVALLLASLVGALVAGRVGAVSSGLNIAVGGNREDSDAVVGVWPEKSTSGGVSGAAHRVTGTPAGMQDTRACHLKRKGMMHFNNLIPSCPIPV